MSTPTIQSGQMPTGVTRTRRGQTNPYVEALQDNITATESDRSASKYAGPFNDTDRVDNSKQTEYDRQRNLLYSARKFVNVNVRTVRQEHNDGTATLHFQVMRTEDGELVRFNSDINGALASDQNTETETRTRSRR